MFKRLSTALLFGVLIFTAVPNISMAAASDATHRAALLEQIEQLLKQVARLQALLEERTNDLSATYRPYESVYFPLNFETVYLVQNAELTLLEGRSNIEEADQELFELFKALVGETAVRTYVKEWRVFENESTDLGAFVELMAGREDWIVGVNRSSFDATNPQIIEAFANLFVHEYAHIIFFSQSEREDRFGDLFWTAADYRHASAVERASSKDRFDVMRRYYDNNQKRFVGDYATMNVDEDMAETFVAFIREPKPTGTTLRDKKVQYFYEYQDWVSLRTVLRERLDEQGVL